MPKSFLSCISGIRSQTQSNPRVFHRQRTCRLISRIGKPKASVLRVFFHVFFFVWCVASCEPINQDNATPEENENENPADIWCAINSREKGEKKITGDATKQKTGPQNPLQKNKNTKHRHSTRTKCGSRRNATREDKEEKKNRRRSTHAETFFKSFYGTILILSFRNQGDTCPLCNSTGFPLTHWIVRIEGCSCKLFALIHLLARVHQMGGVPRFKIGQPAP